MSCRGAPSNASAFWLSASGRYHFAATLASTAIVILAPEAVTSAAKGAPDIGRVVVQPLVRALSSGSSLVAVGEDGSAPLPVVGLLRGDSSSKAVTADGVDTPMGQTNLVLGLAVYAESGVPGAYGTGTGANAVLPSPGASDGFTGPTTGTGGASPVSPTAAP